MATKTAKPAVKTVAKPAAKTVVKKSPVKAPATKAVPKVVAKPLKAEAKPIAKPAAKPVVEAKEKAKKTKLVRDSFTMPETEYAALGEVKKACLKAGIDVKKSELLRVGVSLVRQLDTAKLKEILGGLPTLKAGRPKKSKQ